MFTNFLYFYSNDFYKKKIEIIDASKHLIGEKGVQNLTIKNLAKKMSFSEPALYRHFKDKTQILKRPLLFHREAIKNRIFKILDMESKIALLKITGGIIQSFNK